MIDVEIKVTYGSFAPPKTLLDDIAEIKTKEHTHDNIDAINQVTESVLDDVRSNTNTRHSHSNKDIIDSISADDLNNIDANTAARHSHENASVLGKIGESGGKMTYDGKPIGGGERATDELTFNAEWGDFVILADATVKTVSITVSSDDISERTEIKSIGVLFNGQVDYTDLRDLTLKINENCEPCIVAYHHPTIDEGESGFAGFRIASVNFPFSCEAFNKFNYGNYSAVKVIYYKGA